MLKSAKYAPDPKTPLERALSEVRSTSAIETIATLTRNIAQNPREPKYRKLRLTNAKISAAVADPAGAHAVMVELGWVQAGEEFLELPDTVQLNMTHVRAVEAQAEALEAQAKLKAKARLQARNAKSDPDKERLRLQMEDDKRERAAKAPVTEGSKKQNLPAGANVMTAGDLGINGSGGG